jgi:large subunit ribosomal protein L28
LWFLLFFAIIQPMAKHICEHCGKGLMRGNKVSHAKQRRIRFYKPNLHKTTLVISGVKKHLLLCTTCLRTLKKKLAAQVAPKKASAVK